jgi:hypothetical protein
MGEPPRGLSNSSRFRHFVLNPQTQISGNVRRIGALGDDPLQAELARLGIEPFAAPPSCSSVLVVRCVTKN